MEIKEIIEENLQKAVKNKDEKAIKYWGKSYANYLGTLYNAYYKKTCSKCGRLLLDNEFHKHKGRYKDLHSWCKDCSNAKNQDYHKQHRTEINKKRREVYNTKQGKLIDAMRGARRRGLGFNLLYEVPEGWHGNIDYCYHHINDIDVVAMPEKIHIKYSGGHISLEEHRKRLMPYVNAIYKNKKKRVS